MGDDDGQQPVTRPRHCRRFLDAYVAALNPVPKGCDAARPSEYGESQVRYRRRMRYVIVPAATALLLLAGCGTSTVPVVPAPTSASTPSPTHSPTPSPRITVMAENQQKFLLLIHNSVPTLVDNDDLNAVDIGNGICLRQESGWKALDLNTWVRTSAGLQHGLFGMGVDQADAIISAADRFLCVSIAATS